MLGAIFRVQKDIRITDISVDSTADGAVSNWEDYNVKNIYSSVSLPNANSSVTYVIDITNVGNVEEGIYSITGLPSNLKYSFTNNNYTLKDMLCDDTDPTLCKLGSVSKLYLTISYDTNGYDANNTNYNLDLEFSFKRFHKITYSNLTHVGFPDYIMAEEDLIINFPSPYPSTISVVGMPTYTYDSTTGILTVNDVDADITIASEVSSYFIAYTGNTTYTDANSNTYYKIFNLFDKTNITSFGRNTTKTESEVEAMVNNGTAFVISTSDSDPDYPSTYPVYGWVDNNQLYWWSKANIVYFHPDTIAPFSNMELLVTADLTGTSTIKMKNFAHMFDTCRVLETITGKIETNGLVLEYNPSFNYGNDSNEGPSSGKGMAFMFNDCNALRAIDTSGFVTTNASDMKRMFGGCKSITSIDVSHFDTSNVKSMYWMFRKTEKLVDVDLSNFDTSNVMNMSGMFMQSPKIKTIRLGEHFDTSSVKRLPYMFQSCTALKTIYAKTDFSNSSVTTDSNMFLGDTNLVGAAGMIYETPYSSSSVRISMAKIANANQSGYFTLDSNVSRYTITYNLNGGTAVNPTSYYPDSSTFTLNNPTKVGYTFIGWTGSNGSTPQLTVTIPTGSSGDLSYTANYAIVPADQFPKVFAVSGSCNFNGRSVNITSDDNSCKNDLNGTDYTNNTYIDSGIALFSQANYQKDFEIYLEISNYVPNNQEPDPTNNNNKQNTLVNTKLENQSAGYPGVVFRKNVNNLEVKAWNTSELITPSSLQILRILRINNVIYYSMNNDPTLIPLLDLSTTSFTPFNLTTFFGAAANSSGAAFRHSKMTLTNFYIKLGTYSNQ